MKKKIVRISALKSVLALLLAFVCVFSLPACKKNGGEGEETTTAGGGAESAEDIVLVSGGAPQISIVYQAATNSCILDTADYLTREIESVCGEEIKRMSDALHERADDAFEIVIGSTKYEASAEALAALSENSYSVTVSGKKIILSATNAYLYIEAAKKLVSALTIGDGSAILAGDFSFKSESFSAVSVGANGKSEYTIVYDRRDPEAKTQANEIKTAFRDMGIIVECIEDAENSDGKEIIVGNADRDICFDAGHYYKNAWIGKDSDGNIAITGAIVSGAKQFSEYIYNLGANNGNIALLDNMFGNFAPEGYGNAPKYEGSGEVEVFDGFERNTSYYVIVHGASGGDYEDYIQILKDNGFRCFDEKKLNGNSFSTYFDGFSIVTLSQIKYNDPATQDRYAGVSGIGNVNYMSISIESAENMSLPTRTSKWDKVTTVQLSTVGTECGYVIRLEDGRFIVIDGGTGEQAKEVYDIITSQNKLSGNPVIAAWLITHGHSDHIGAILNFITSYSSKAKIESVIHHLPAFSLYDGKNNLELDADNQKKVANALRSVSQQLYDKMAKAYPAADIIVAHAGQKFELPGLTIDVLLTSENLYKKQMRDTNMSSVVYSLTGSAGRMIILGDQQESGCAILNAIYGDTLKCDIVQVSHHGFNGGDADMYESMDAKYAIWSNSAESVVGDKLYNQTTNFRNFFDCTTVEANLAASIDDDEPIILTDTMTESQILKLDLGIPR